MDTDGLVPLDSGVLVLDIGIDNWTRPCCAQTGCRRPRDVFDTKPYAWLQQATKPRVSPYGAMLGQRYNSSDRYLLEGLESMTCGTQHVLHPSHSSARREPFSYPSLGLSFRYSKASWLARIYHSPGGLGEEAYNGLESMKHEDNRTDELDITRVHSPD